MQHGLLESIAQNPMKYESQILGYILVRNRVKHISRDESSIIIGGSCIEEIPFQSSPDSPWYGRNVLIYWAATELIN